MEKRSRRRMLAAMVAVVPLSTGMILAYVLFLEGIPLYESLGRRMVEGAVIAALIAGTLMLLLATAFSRRVEYGRLKERDEILAAILDNLNEGVLATNLSGRILFSNPAARSMLGIQEEEEKEREAPRKIPDPWEDFKLREAVARCARDEECTEVRVPDEDTVLRINLERMAAFDDHKGGVLVVLQDLSEGRRLEANQQRFLANAAHELRTPLSNIAFAAELLTSGADEDPETRRRFLNHIVSAAHRMQKLSDTLLRLARIGWERREPVIEPVSPGEVARSVTESMLPLAESAGVQINLKGEDALVLADAAMLEQVLLSLVSNAIKHSNEGSEVTVRLEGSTIFVEDQGKGISRDEIPYVFERFYRGKEGGEGFGLGLSICKTLVESMNGEISLRSQEGTGTTVEVWLPEADKGA